MSDVTPQMLKTLEHVRSYIVLNSRAFAELMICVPTLIDLECPFYGYSTRSKTFVSRRFFEELNIKEQAAVVVHEVMHIACQHVNSTLKGNYHPLIANIAQDTLINEAIKSQSWLQLPKDSISFSSILGKQQKPWEQWSWQQVYFWLLKNLPRYNADSKKSKGKKNNKEDFVITVDSSYLPPGEKENQELIKPDNFNPDISFKPEKDEQQSSNHEEITQQTWEQRLQRAIHSDKPGGLLLKVAGLIPQSKTDYRKVFRYALTTAMRNVYEENINRPSRRYLAKTISYYEPSVRPKNTKPIITVVFDTSGSIVSTNYLPKFVAELQSIQRRYQADVYLINCDTKVQTEYFVKSSDSLLNMIKTGQIQIKGGGGTDFAPAIKRAEELRSKVCVYFTDMYGNFGSAPRKMKVIWVTTTETKAPFGQIITLREES